MKYFSIRELSRSETASRKGINNTPNSAVVSALTALIDNVLDPLREKWGAPIIVTSGYRSPALNRAVGGASGSQHTKGEAADIRSVSDSIKDNKELFNLVLQMLKDKEIKVGQLIDEYGYNWVHVSLPRSGKVNNQILHIR